MRSTGGGILLLFTSGKGAKLVGWLLLLSAPQDLVVVKLRRLFFYRHWQAAPNLWTYTYFSTEYGSAIISRRTFEDISQLSLQK